MLSRLMTIREQLLLLGVAGAILLGSGVLVWRATRSPAPALPPPKPAEAGAQTTPVTPTPVLAPAAALPAPPAAAPAQKAPAPPERIAVGILGAVNKEGLYYFDQGARVRDLLAAAGGTLEDSDLSDINRTALLIDETTLLVPRLIRQGKQAFSDPPVTYNPRPYTRSTWYQFNKQTQEPEPLGATSPDNNGPAVPKAQTGGLIDLNTATQAELESLPGIGPATAQKIIAYRQSAPFQTIEDLEKVSGIGPAKMNAVRGLVTVK